MTHSFIRPILSIAFLWGVVSALQAQSIARLPVYSSEELRSKTDWLLAAPAQKSAVYQTKEGFLALSNGLITRTFSLEPNGASVGLDNLTTGESLLRSVSPEAILWINGHEIKVGGLTGQPIQNYLLTGWLKTMKADPYSLKMLTYEVSPIKKRMEWNRRTAWSTQKADWPPKGLEVTFTYGTTDDIIRNNQNRLTSDDRRTKLLDDGFRSLSPDWKIVASPGNQSASFTNEGKAGEIQIPANSTLFAERSLPEKTAVVICKLNSGTDQSVYYGPGVALTFADRPPLKFYLSPGNRQFGLQNGDNGEFFEGFDPAKSWYLRIELALGKVLLSVSEDGIGYRTLRTLDLASVPKGIRIGKTDQKGNTSEQPASQSTGRCRIEQLTLLGGPQNPGADLDFLKGLVVKVHYELYDGLPLLSKWVTVETASAEGFVLNNLRTEHLAVTEAESSVEAKRRWELPPIFAQSDFAFQSMAPNASENACVEWQEDATYRTQVNYSLKTPSVLVCQPRQGVGQKIVRGQPFESMRLWELLYDSGDRERRGLAQRKMYRTIAPWVTENPILMHIRSSADADVKKAVDQCAEAGFEMAILTFGSGFNIEDSTRQNRQRMKALKDYAASKGIAIGGYSLLASRSIDKENDVVMPKPGMSPIFGHSPCLESGWGQRYFENLYRFYKETGMDILEHDGSYPGDICASTSHPGHAGLEDSQWKQFARIRDFYQWCRGKGIYLNVPDWYFLAGSNKIAMGYRETNWSLPREYQEIIERQNIYDGTWEKTPSMGWMFVPLVEYHGGGPAATIEPLKDHLPHYEQRMANLFGAGVQACYRGPQLYDAPETKAVVKKWVGFYKKHRPILDADLIHLRRPDGRDYDAILHVNAAGKEKGLLMVYNPLDEPITRTLTVDLYYTGLKNRVAVSKQDGAFASQPLDGSKLTLRVTIPAKSQTWYVFQ
ncbi:hypothetical protein [Larkinella punicea]|uniref:Alpha-galactosidase n=1 Tax=Larkinella punicea TaxID=2315727 RepID=A0A368JCT8_9BACT|nr:hypothetical protein [Larkinella punicea]RCR65478.1 hypothetical protein DUE52_31705 [Larkinella punicea]